MPEDSPKFSNIWQELKDRKVLRMITVYVAAVFGLMELIDIITGPLNLPGWVLTAVIFLSAIGFPVAVVLSWLFYATPEGIKRYRQRKPEPLIESESEGVSVEVEQFTDYSFADGLITYDSDSPYGTAPGKSEKRIGRIYGFSSFAVIGIVIASFLFFSGKSAPFDERDWVVIADFINHTEESIFDKSLSAAFEISIDQSRHINVVPRKRIQESLKRIGKERTEFIDEELCREIAMREGVKVYIIPEISKVGRNYILTSKIQETETGSVFRSEVIYIDNQDEILQKLDRLCKKLRRFLGESRFKIAGQNKPLIEVTTSSLDALKQYSMAIEYHINLDFDNAVLHYRNAIRLDSSFTAAKASLGTILFERYDQEEGMQWLDEAIQTIDNLTEREKYSILASYAANVEKDLDKSIEYTRMNIDLYPDDALQRNNMGWYLQNKGDYQGAAREYSAAIRLDPYTLITYTGLTWIYQEHLGNMDSVFYWSNELIKYGPENPWGYTYLGSAYVCMNEYEKAVDAYLKARELNPGFILNLYRLAHTYRIRGELDNAVEILKKILEINPYDGPAIYILGVYYQLMDKEELAREQYLKFKTYTDHWEKEFPDSPDTYFWKGLVLTRLGENKAGMEAGRKALELDPAMHFRFAELLAVQNKTEEALDRLELALENGYRNHCWMIINPDLMTLLEEVRFEELLSQYFISGDKSR